MGEIAEMLINGDLDFYTGEYIGRGKGYPRTLDGSLPWENVSKRKERNARYGVFNYIKQNQLDSSPEKVIRRYCNDALGFNPQGKGSIRKACITIQEDFRQFAKFCKTYSDAASNNATSV